MTNDSEQEGSTAEQPWSSLDFEVSTSPAKRPRTLGVTQSPMSSSKGKEKIEQIEDGNDVTDAKSESNICGICFSEDGKAIRGWIDCCNHYFCFICIMEWAKVESRCPMCKQRFSTIRRPPKYGIFPNERIVNVPVRDQIWHPFGNATTGPPDPYAQVNCTVCQSSLDENLLLLCDLCDSAVHTYCAGLGCTVPEGDWYCHDCNVSRNDHTNNENDGDSSQFSRNFNPKQVAGASASIFEIVQESYFLEVERPSRDSPCPGKLLSPSVSDRDCSSRTKVLDPNVRTLHHCRNVQSRIQSLRENWNALRSGSLSFYSSLPYPEDKNKDKSRPLNFNLSQSQPLSTIGSSKKKNDETVSCSTLNSKSSHDINKAWRMMNMARSMHKAGEGTITDCKAGKRNVPRVSPNSSSGCSMLKGKLLTGKDLGKFQSENYRCHDLEMAQNMHRSKKSENQNLSKDLVNEMSKFYDRSASMDIPQSFEFPFPGQVHTLASKDLGHRSGGNLTMKVMDRGNSSSNGCREPKCLDSLSSSSAAGSDLSFRISECGTSSGCEMKLPKEKNEVGKTPFEVGVKKDDGAKSEVQSLVKLNLKLLSRDKKIDVKEFKAIARLATHTILAACGLEHRKSSSSTIPKLICKHSGRNQLPHMSNLMPSSCRECFYVFVKDLVFSIMTERVAYTQSNCPI